MSSAAQPYTSVGSDLDAEDAKDALREQLRRNRLDRSERLRQEASEALADVVERSAAVQAARCVALYTSRPHEPGTGPLLERLRERGVRVLLPVLGEGLSRGWALYRDPEDLQTRAPGRPLEPSGPNLGAEALADAEVVLAPALAVDTSGVRLGQGGGWYDRALLHAEAGTLIAALVYPEEVYDAAERPLPVEEHDRRVHAIATPQGWQPVRSPDA